MRPPRGAALLSAMLTVALVASLAASALWLQWRSVEIEAAQRARSQSLWILTGALDWARLILREDARSGGADHLGEPWAVPLAEARLSTFLAANASDTDLGSDADQVFLSGSIMDLQARLNVFNLVDNGKLSEPDLRAFARLFAQIGVPSGELAALAENLRFALDKRTDSTATQRAPLLPQRVEQLRWLGLSARSLTMLAPYITLLPMRTPVNLNTASVPVLHACIPGLDLAQAQRLATARQSSHFRSLADASKVINEAPPDLNDAQHSVQSRFFEIQGRLRMDQTIVMEQSVVQRDGLQVKTLWRDRGPTGIYTPSGAGANLQ
ncbi:MAG: type II secretion system minor pseudopilin GspK [Rhodoferax sp.]